MRLFHSLIVLAVVLAGCAGTQQSDPDRYSIDPSEAAHLSATQPLAIRNAYDGPNLFSLPGGNSLDQHDYTNSAVAVLSRALEKQGVRVAKDAKKSVTLRVRMTGHAFRMLAPFTPQSGSRLVLEATLGNGTMLKESAEDWVFGPYHKSFDASVLRALTQLVKRDDFVAYLKE